MIKLNDERGLRHSCIYRSYPETILRFYWMTHRHALSRLLTYGTIVVRVISLWIYLVVNGFNSIRSLNLNGNLVASTAIFLSVCVFEWTDSMNSSLVPHYTQHQSKFLQLLRFILPKSLFLDRKCLWNSSVIHNLEIECRRLGGTHFFVGDFLASFFIIQSSY